MVFMRIYMWLLYMLFVLFGLLYGLNLSFVEFVKVFDVKVNSKFLYLLLKVKKVYCFFVCCVLSLNVFCYILSFWVGIDFVLYFIVLRIVVLVWFIENVVNCIVFFVFFENKNYFECYV